MAMPKKPIPLREWLLENTMLTPDLPPEMVKRILHQIDWDVRAFSNEEAHMERSLEFWLGADRWKKEPSDGD